MIKVNYLNYDLHKQTGIDAFQNWLEATITSECTLLNVGYGEGLKVEIVVWDDGQGDL